MVIWPLFLPLLWVLQLLALTWNRNAEGPDHNASSEFMELKELSRQIKEVHTSVGNLNNDGKKLSQGEVINRANLSKGLYSNRSIKVGEVIAVMIWYAGPLELEFLFK